MSHMNQHQLSEHVNRFNSFADSKTWNFLWILFWGTGLIASILLNMAAPLVIFYAILLLADMLLFEWKANPERYDDWTRDFGSLFVGLTQMTVAVILIVFLI